MWEKMGALSKAHTWICLGISIFWAYKSWDNYTNGNQDAGFAYSITTASWVALAVSSNTVGYMKSWIDDLTKRLKEKSK